MARTSHLDERSMDDHEKDYEVMISFFVESLALEEEYTPALCAAIALFSFTFGCNGFRWSCFY